jgi:hypothetical protein
LAEAIPSPEFSKDAQKLYEYWRPMEIEFVFPDTGEK